MSSPPTEEPVAPVVKIEPSEPQPAAVGDEAPAQPAVVTPAVQAVMNLVGRLEDRGLFTITLLGITKIR